MGSSTHRSARLGQRRTLPHPSAQDKVQFILHRPASCRERTAAIGPACALFIDTRLGDRPLDRLRSAQGVRAWPSWS
jgi:hypothetical protein